MSIVPYVQVLSKWKLYKQASKVAAALAASTSPGHFSPEYYPARAYRMADCSKRIDYTYCPECGSMHIARTYLCRDRLCPLCQWRLSLQRIGDMMYARLAVQPVDTYRRGHAHAHHPQRAALAARTSRRRFVSAWRRLTKRRQVARWVAATRAA